MKIKGSFLLAALILLQFSATAQYEFKEDTRLQCTSVKNQQKTGTCWCFSTLSFLESELMRQGKTPLDISEMYLVRQIYLDKAQNYILRQGKAQFSQGSLAHDALRAIHMAGLMPEEAYSGRNNEGKHNHSALVKELKAIVDEAVARDTLTGQWREDFTAVLDAHLGEVPTSFMWEGREMKPEFLAMELDINPEDYRHYTSFTHHDFYTDFILEIPDNYSNGSYRNVPLDELVSLIDKSLEQGYTVAWDGDVSEPGFSARHGLAVLPADPNQYEEREFLKAPVQEMEVDQKNRQAAFESYETTDDHLMHIVGKATDQNGTEYYIIKNSWGELSDYKGFLYMSENYLRMKTVAVTFHKDIVMD